MKVGRDGWGQGHACHCTDWRGKKFKKPVTFVGHFLAELFIVNSGLLRFFSSWKIQKMSLSLSLSLRVCLFLCNSLCVCVSLYIYVTLLHKVCQCYATVLTLCACVCLCECMSWSASFYGIIYPFVYFCVSILCVPANETCKELFIKKYLCFVYHRVGLG